MSHTCATKRGTTAADIDNRPRLEILRTHQTSAGENASIVDSAASPPPPVFSRIKIPVDGQDHKYSALVLRDACQCPLCVHEHTKQRLFSAPDIPVDIGARSITLTKAIPPAVELTWESDVPGFDRGHVTSIDLDTLRDINRAGVVSGPFQAALPEQHLWDAETCIIADFSYSAYMNDDRTLYQVIKQLHSHGLVFLTDVPSVQKSVSTVAERIGPVKDTFYGFSWDVRTEPKAINAAYTSADLGFHTDLLYFYNPAYVQLLHCIVSASAGGASVFVDAFKAAEDLYNTDIEAFKTLANTPVNYHYKHPDSNLYQATKPVFDLRPLRIGNVTFNRLSEFLQAWTETRSHLPDASRAATLPLGVADCLEKVNWGPPFLAPFTLYEGSLEQAAGEGNARENLNDKAERWHAAAKKFNDLLQRPGGLHERLMKPGECVLFNNTRVLHSRKAFNAGDVGKHRWLRGTYVDKDPYMSKLRVLRDKFENLEATAA